LSNGSGVNSPLTRVDALIISPTDAGGMTAQTSRNRPGEVHAEASRSDGAAFVRGTPAARGAHVGVARVIANGDDIAKIQPGDVLVWAVVWPRMLAAPIGALVTDAGGVLSNPAIIARERGIPAVIATRDGTRRIRDGQRVAVDGARGVVTILE
jgi:pyruvate,water dikinase